MNQPEPYMTDDQLRAIFAGLERHHLHAMFGVKVERAADGQAVARCTLGQNHMNILGSIHGGVYYVLLDVASYCAALTVLPISANAATIDIHVSVLRPAKIGDEMELRGEVRKRGRSLIFLESQALVNGKPAALAHVTKSIAPFDMRKLMQAG